MMALQAAVDGQGVMLASRLLAQDDLRAGRLVHLFPQIPPVPSAFALYLVFRSERQQDPRIAALLDWLQAEFSYQAALPLS
jgi:LysR family glycine cleavage system transcriptional activator